jgi:anti-sigma B factor antagonist
MGCCDWEATVALSIRPDAGEAGTITLAVTGDVDLGSVELLREAITQAVKAEDARAIVVDLAGVGFLDSTGIGALIAGWRLADDNAKGYRLAEARGMVREVLEVTAVWGLMGAGPGE